LTCGFFFTGSYGINRENLDSYEEALSLQSYIDTIMDFQNFKLEDYPVVFYQDGRDYVCYEGEVTSRKPVIGTMVGTAFFVDDRYEVFVPDIRDMALLAAAAGRDEGQLLQIRTIWHEAFHAWQQTCFDDNLNSLVKDINFESQEAEELMWDIDTNEAYRIWFTREIELLNQALEPALDPADRKAVLANWQNHQNDYDKLGLSDKQQRLIDYYQLAEGSAFYVESRIYLELAEEIAYNEWYGVTPFTYTNGTMKYYQCGMLKCLLLDELTPDWQSDFDCSRTMTDYLKTVTE